MNFFQAQEQARKQTRWLILLFVLAIGGLIVLTCLSIAVFVWFSSPSTYAHTLNGNVPSQLWFILTHLGSAKLLTIAGLIIGIVGLASLFRWLDLKQGGAVIARELGGQLVQPNTRDLKQRRLLNVVEEMALASGIPAPQVFLLEQETGINAFAAGLSLEDAVIGVTRGCLENLNREQLQGVIAHEFSHILNGDMRMNQQLVAILSGLVIISQTGRWMLELTRNSRVRSGRDRGNAAGAFLLLGICLLILGWLGQFFGALIRAAVSRQREFLADASAVQFTRNPEGIGGALQVIGGYSAHAHVQHHRASELGHFFFCDAVAFRAWLFSPQWLATHPPLDARIQRVMPAWNGAYLKPSPSTLSAADDASELSGLALFTPAGVQINQDGSIDYRPPAQSKVSRTIEPLTTGAIQFEHRNKASVHPNPASLEQLTLLIREPVEAKALVLAFLLAPDQPARRVQQTTLQGLPQVLQQRIVQIRALLEQVNEAQYLSLLELAMPALKALSAQQYETLRHQMSALIHADGRISTFEWALFQIVRTYADVHFGLSKPPKPKFRTWDSIAPFYVCVLSRLIHLGHDNDNAKAVAWELACGVAGIHDTPLLPSEQCQTRQFSLAAAALARAFPLLKPRMLKGLIKAAQSDGIVLQEERLLITTLSIMMDCPLVGLELQ